MTPKWCYWNWLKNSKEVNSSRKGMEHYQLIIAYDGTGYHGFQRQEGFRTVQSELEEALRKITWKGERIRAAGRTDAGVHASGQVVTFFHEWTQPLWKMKNALNFYLPDEISVRSIQVVEPQFHARYDALSREYHYRITNSSEREPLKERFMWRVNAQLDWDDLQSAAEIFLGEHDFSRFGRPLKPGGSTVRNVIESRWEKESSIDYCYVIKANAFLYHMVRRIVYTMVQVGIGRFTHEMILEALQGANINLQPGIAPACGLTLKHVSYE